MILIILWLILFAIWPTAAIVIGIGGLALLFLRMCVDD